MSSFTLKIFALITMVIDHIGFVFFPNSTILRTIGRLSMPLFAFQIALGFKHTKSREKYILRMLLLAIISQIPFALMYSTNATSAPLNIGFTFLLSLLFLYSLNEIKPIYGKIIGSIVILASAYFLKYDYWLYGFSLPIIYYYFMEKPSVLIPLLFLATTMHCIYRNNVSQLFALLSIFLITSYNGKKGKSFKGFFYIFYPLHMIIIFVIYKILS